MTAQHQDRKRQGFTLVELLVYVAITGVVVIIAGQLYVDAMAFQLRTSNKTMAARNTAEIMQYLEEDLRRLGAKGWMNGDTTTGVLDPRGYVDTSSASPDSSSFIPGDESGGTGRDSIRFFAGVYDSTGKVSSVATITWWVENGTLKRRYVDTTYSKTLVIAENVTEFNIEYGVYSNETQANPVMNYNADSGTFNATYLQEQGFNTTVSDTAGAVVVTVGAAADGGAVLVSDAAGLPAVHTLQSGHTYGIDMWTHPSTVTLGSWSNDSDYAAVCVRPSGDTSQRVPGVSDMLFYASDLSFYKRHFEFTPSGDVDVDAIYYLKFKSHFANQVWQIKSWKTWEMSKAQFDWRSSFASGQTLDKRNVKAVQVTVSTSKGGNPKSAQSSSIARIIPTPNNGV